MIQPTKVYVEIVCKAKIVKDSGENNNFRKL